MENYGFMCDVGGKPKGNQDSALYNEFNLIFAPGSPEARHFAYPGIMAIICDGVSGSNHGEKGSTFVTRYLSASIMNDLLIENFDFRQIKTKLGNFINSTNSALLKKFSASIATGKVPKTTLVGLMVIGQYLWCFNMGDSRAFLIKDDKIGQISKDHIGTGAQHEITQAMGQEKIDPAIGFYNWAYEASQDTTNLSYNSNYYALICSDGLTDVVNNNEIKTIILDSKINTLEEKVEKLYSLAMEREIEDNVSIIAIDLANYFKKLNTIQILKLSQ